MASRRRVRPPGPLLEAAAEKLLEGLSIGALQAGDAPAAAYLLSRWGLGSHRTVIGDLGGRRTVLGGLGATGL